MTRATCIDLKKRFGKEYRITYDESYYAERPEFRSDEEVWLQQIPCRRGHICPWGRDLLTACTSARGTATKRLLALRFIERGKTMDADDGVNVVFHVEHFAAVAEIMQPRRRRRLSPEARAAAAERLRQYQFTARQDDSKGQGRTQSSLFDLGAVQTV